MEKHAFKEKIYDYINSRAISEHCRKIKHEFLNHSQVSRHKKAQFL